MSIRISKSVTIVIITTAFGISSFSFVKVFPTAVHFFLWLHLDPVSVVVAVIASAIVPKVLLDVYEETFGFVGTFTISFEISANVSMHQGTLGRKKQLSFRYFSGRH